jgi:hypothetical protein
MFFWKKNQMGIFLNFWSPFINILVATIVLKTDRKIKKTFS